MKTITLAYLLTNRGRADTQVLNHLNTFFQNTPHYILLLDETDATDAHLNGRKIFTEISEINENGKIIVSDDLDVGINLVASPELAFSDIKYELINENNLKFPQGKSEHYKHFKITLRTDFKEPFGKLKGIIIIAQHNSAFIRPFTRAIQSSNAMKELAQLQKDNPEYLCILVRDQNTMIPGEGKTERFLRRKYGLECITDKIERTYNLDNLEGDTGGLNKFAVWFNKIGGFKVLRKVITIVDKVESICIVKGQDTKFNITITPNHEEIENLDHGMISIKIDNNVIN